MGVHHNRYRALLSIRKPLIDIGKHSNYSIYVLDIGFLMGNQEYFKISHRRGAISQWIFANTKVDVVFQLDGEFFRNNKDKSA
jgi:hypothetical protein